MKNRTILLQLQAFLDLIGAHFSFLFVSFPGSKFTEMQKLTVRPLLCFISPIISSVRNTSFARKILGMQSRLRRSDPKASRFVRQKKIYKLFRRLQGPEAFELSSNRAQLTRFEKMSKVLKSGLRRIFNRGVCFGFETKTPRDKNFVGIFF